MQCFQKDCNLRVSAKKLSKHPWIQMSKKKASGSQRSREKAIPAYEEAVKSVQQWNEALKGSSTMSMNRNSGNIRRISGKVKGDNARSDRYNVNCQHKLNPRLALTCCRRKDVGPERSRHYRPVPCSQTTRKRN